MKEYHSPRSHNHFPFAARTLGQEYWCSSSRKVVCRFIEGGHAKAGRWLQISGFSYPKEKGNMTCCENENVNVNVPNVPFFIPVHGSGEQRVRICARADEEEDDEEEGLEVEERGLERGAC